MLKGSIREAIALVRAYFKMEGSDSYQNLPDRAISSTLRNISINRIKQTTDKRKLWQSPNIFTVLPCLQLKQVPLAECCGYTSACTIARTIVQLPKIAEGTNFGMLIQGVYSVDTVSRRFIESTPDRYVNSLNLGLQTGQIHFWLQNKYLYLGDENIKQIRISAYFEEDMPADLISYPSTCGQAQTLSKGCCPAADQVNYIAGQDQCCPPNPYDLPWKVPGYLEQDIIAETAKLLMTTYKRSIDDTGLPGKDDNK